MPRVNLFVEVVAGGLTQPVVLPRSVKWVPAYSWQGHCTSGTTALPEMMQPAATGWIWNSNTTNYPEVTERTCPWSGFISQITSSCIITRHYLLLLGPQLALYIRDQSWLQEKWKIIRTFVTESLIYTTISREASSNKLLSGNLFLMECGIFRRVCSEDLRWRVLFVDLRMHSLDSRSLKWGIYNSAWYVLCLRRLSRSDRITQLAFIWNIDFNLILEVTCIEWCDLLSDQQRIIEDNVLRFSPRCWIHVV